MDHPPGPGGMVAEPYHSGRDGMYMKAGTTPPPLPAKVGEFPLAGALVIFRTVVVHGQFPGTGT